jgi:hypothetical protein
MRRSNETQPHRIRGEGSTGNLERGRTAELVAAEWFRNRGHRVTDVSHLLLQHDLEVEGVGRVQVKTASLQHKNNGSVYVVGLGGSNGRRYARDAFDALLMVWFGKVQPRCVLVKADRLAAQDSDCMKQKLQIGKSAFEMRWSTVKVAESVSCLFVQDGRHA